VDINGDGHTDILSGTYSRMTSDMAGTFQVLYGTKDGFEPAEELNGTDNEPLIIPATREQMTQKICTRPFAADINDDGHLDIITGNFDGTFYLFEGLGKGRFKPECTKLETEKGDLKIKQAHSDPFLVDFDGDGDLDILSGSAQGGVFLITNEGTRKAPKFTQPTTIIKPAGHQQDSKGFGDAHLKGPQSGTRVWAADVNGDKKLDLLVGDNTQLFHLADGADEAEAKAKDAEWKERMDRLMADQRSRDAQGMEKWMEEYQSLQEERLEYVVPERTGFVWLYLAK
jgi:hypothetical protein